MTSRTLPSENTFAIGDIHGCLKTLRRLIESLPLNKDSVLIFLGDYVDRGPDSKGVIDYLINLSEQVTCHFLLGNHEEMMMEFLETGNVNTWMMNGARETLVSYGAKNPSEFRLPDPHRFFLANCKYYLDSPDFFFVHAGTNPSKSIADAIKSNDRERFIWERDHLRTSKRKWEKTVVCGHTPHDQPVLEKNLIVIDTGCVYTYPRFARDMGILTAIQLPSRRIFQADNCEYSHENA